MSLFGKTAIVTGGASGIGLATAKLLAARGAAVTIWDRQVPLEPGEIPYALIDLTQPEAIRAAAAGLGPVHILAHCAGIQTYGTAAGTTDEIWDQTMLVNLNAAFYVCRALLPKMIEAGGASISLVGSVQSVGALANSAAYVTSKHALLGLARSIALDYAPAGVRCNCVCPGAIDTPMLRHSAELSGDAARTLEACARVHPLGRIGQAEDIARVIAFLSGEDSSFVTGTAFLADGGAMIQIGGPAFAESGTARR
jgi:NAD(P)-dependent dehydrogenase (short-subunit alcohol dehydrogenase family)